MPETTVMFFKEVDGNVPLTDWLVEQPRPVRARCSQRLRALETAGHELRRPIADNLRDGIHELRVRVGRVHYRILYFFAGRNVAIVSHGFGGKEGSVPDVELRRAVRRKVAFESNPAAHASPRED